MSPESNIATLQSLYQAFGSGDVEAILACVADEVDWAADASSSDAPWYGRRTNKQEVAKFFADIAGALQVLEFDPVAMAANDDAVFAFIRFSFRNAETGQEATGNLHHYFRFADGKIVYYRGSEDTALTAEILSGSRSREQMGASV